MFPHRKPMTFVALFFIVALLIVGPPLPGSVGNDRQRAFGGSGLSASSLPPTEAANAVLGVWHHFRSCLALSSPACAPANGGAALRAPPSIADHAAHFAEVQAHFAPFRALEVHGYAGYGGPWVENSWITKFGSEGADFWYPVVPLLAQWTDAAFGPSLHRNAALAAQLELAARSFFGPDGNRKGQALARSDMVYLTVVQHDDGVPWRSILDCEAYRNVFVLGAASWGNAAVPYVFAPPPILNAPKPVRRELAASFLGTIMTYRRRLPGLLHNSSLPDTAWRIAQASREETFRISAGSLFALAPRGYGRMPIKVTEMLQSGGIVPLAIYDDADPPWLPFSERTDVWGIAGVAFAVPWRGLGTFFCAACELIGESAISQSRWALLMAAPRTECACPEARWRSLHGGLGFFVPPMSTLAAMEQRARVLGPALFNPSGILENIRRLVRGPFRGERGTNFTCVAKPETLRVPWQYEWRSTFDNFDFTTTLTGA